MNNLWLSIIIPLYNPSLDLLEICINSTLNILAPMEIILVDDGSENCVSEFYHNMSADRRIRYFYQPNSGVSVARNLGIEKACGEYLFFLDADDEIPLQWCTFINNEYTQLTSEWILFNITDYFTNSKKTKERNIFINKNENIAIEQIALIMVQSNVLNESWGKLISRKLVNDSCIIFPPGVKQGEDVCFNTLVLNSVNSVQCYPISSYTYKRVDSNNTERLVRAPYDYFDDLGCYYAALYNLVDCQLKGNPEMLVRLFEQVISEIGSTVLKLTRHKMLDRPREMLIEKWIANRPEILSIRRNQLHSLKSKLMYTLLKNKMWNIFRICGAIIKSR